MIPPSFGREFVAAGQRTHDVYLHGVSESGQKISILDVCENGAAVECDAVKLRMKEVRAILARDGHVLVRGLRLSNVEDCATVRDCVLGSRAAYKEKATPRSDFGDQIFSSTDLPADQSIAPHNENSYTLSFPSKLLFFCLDAPQAGGATTVCDVRKVLKHLPFGLRAKFRRDGWMLARNFRRHLGLDWRVAYSCEDIADLERSLRDSHIGFRWVGDCLQTFQRRSAIIRHPATHEEVWFNHVAFWNRWSLDNDVREVMEESFGVDGLPFDTFYGTGEHIVRRDIEIINQVIADCTIREPWRVGDVLVIDNILCAHGRDQFSGTRRIAVAMGDAVEISDCEPTSLIEAGKPLSS